MGFPGQQVCSELVPGKALRVWFSVSAQESNLNDFQGWKLGHLTLASVAATQVYDSAALAEVTVLDVCTADSGTYHMLK